VAVTAAVPPFRVGLIGYGLAGACFHAPFITTTPGLHLAAVVTGNPERQQQVAADYPGVRIAKTVDELWQEAGGLDLVVVATANRSHVPLARAAIAAGSAVVVDKPIAATAADARQLIDEASAAGRILTVFQNRRWDGDFLTLRQLLSDGALGEPRRFESRFERWRPEPNPGWRQRSDPADAGGLLYDFGAHLIDQALLLFGDVDDVYAELDRRHPSASVDDDSFVALTHRSGVRSHLFMSVMAAQAGPRFRMLGSRAAYVKFGLDVQEAALRAGERPGGAAWGEEAPDRWGRIGAGDSLRSVPTRAGAYQAFYAGMVPALRGEAPPPVDPADAVRALEIIAAAQRSNTGRQVVRLVPEHQRASTSL
jgi:predicted dehydrogenase